MDVDISSAVAVGTPINVMNSRDYFATPVLSTTYVGGTINLPMTGLTVASVICDTTNPLDDLHAAGFDGPGLHGFHRESTVNGDVEVTWRKYFMSGGRGQQLGHRHELVHDSSSAGPNNTTHAVAGDDVILDVGLPELHHRSGGRVRHPHLHRLHGRPAVPGKPDAVRATSPSRPRRRP